MDKEAIFLIKQNENVVVQFRVAEEILLQKDIAFDKWMDTDKIRRQIAKQSPSGPVSTQIRDLRHGMKKINLKAEVLETQKPKQVHTQFGNAVMMTNATIGDESGKIKLLLWDQQVNAVATGDLIEIKNASVSTFKGEKQLRLGKTGTLTVTQSGASRQKTSEESDAKKVVCA